MWSMIVTDVIDWCDSFDVIAVIWLILVLPFSPRIIILPDFI